MNKLLNNDNSNNNNNNCVINQQSKEESMQIELSSLWVAVQELNKLGII
jgi:hypothetical protein